MRKLLIHSLFYRNILRFVTLFKYYFYYVRSFLYQKPLYPQFLPHKLGQICQGNIYFSLLLLFSFDLVTSFSQDRNFKKLLGKLESTHAHRKLEQKLFFCKQQVSGRKPDTFQPKLFPSFSQTKVISQKSLSETNILTKNLKASVLHCCQLKGLTTTRCESKIYLYHLNFC